METNYRIAYNKGWHDLKGKEPEEIAARLAVSYSADNRQFTVTFFAEDYVLDCESETIWRKADGKVPEIMTSIIILNYLSYSEKAQKPAGEWVSLKEMPNGGALFYPAFHKNTIQVLIDSFGKQAQKLVSCATKLNGQPTSMGSAAVIFQAFPEIPLCIVIWEGDEDVPANATVLYDPTTSYLLHIETVIGLGMYVADKLQRLAAVEKSRSAAAKNND